MVVCSTHVLQHVIHLRQPHGAPCSTSLQAFQHTKPGQKLSGCKRCRQRHLPRHKTCASASTLSQNSHVNNSAAIADQDIFLIAGAGIAGLAMAAALIKVSFLFSCLAMSGIAHLSALPSLPVKAGLTGMCTCKQFLRSLNSKARNAC